MLAPDKPFQPSLMFTSRVRAYPNEAPFVHKHLTCMERLAKDKHSSLLQTVINYGYKMFYHNGPVDILEFQTPRAVLKNSLLL